MRHIEKSLVTLVLACSPVCAQENAHVRLHDALLLEQQGQFERAIIMTKEIIGSNQLSGVESGRACIVLGLAYETEGKFSEAQRLFDKALRVFQTDAAHISDYASALSNYAGLYVDMGRLEEAAVMWHKALDAQLQIGDQAAIMRTFTRLAGLSLAQKRWHEASDWLKKASAQTKLAQDVRDDDLAFFFETQGWLGLLQDHPSAAIAGYERALELTRRNHGERHWLTGYEQLLLGKALAQSGEVSQALSEMQQGLAILGSALGPGNPKYLAGEIAYSQVLDQAGSHAEARQLRATAEQASKNFYGSQCVGCTISVAAFR
jgi:tetratricopeptide (TPR) repeat protein